MHHLVVLPAGEDRELLADALWMAGAVGVEDLSAAVRGAFTDSGIAKTVATQLGGTIEVVADPTGLDAWRAHATVHQAGPFTVRPPWLDSHPEAVDLVIDPRHAFGSGSHPSTRLALEILASAVTAGDHVLDVGTGSGILAIGAARLGAAYVVAVDTDPNAEAAVRANVEANGVGSLVAFTRADGVTLRGTHDLGVCNMTIDLHEELGPTVAARTTIGRMVVAGILVGDQERRAVAAHARTEILDRRADGDWAALLLG